MQYNKEILELSQFTVFGILATFLSSKYWKISNRKEASESRNARDFVPFCPKCLGMPLSEKMSGNICRFAEALKNMKLELSCPPVP